MFISGRLYSIASVRFIPFRGRLYGYFAALLLLLYSSIQAQPNENTLQLIEMDTGEQLIGEVLPKSSDSTLYLRSSLLGEIALPRSRILHVKVASEVTSSLSVAETSSKGKASEPTASVAAPKKDPIVKKKEAIHPPAKATVVDKSEPPMLAKTPTEIGLFDYLLGLSAPDSWSGNARVGINISTGDSQWTQTYLRGKLEVRPKGKSRLYRYTGSYTYQENEKSTGKKFRSQDKYDLSMLFRQSFKNNWFIQNSTQFRVDQKKGIDRDLSNLIGVGYGFRPIPKVEFNLGGAGGIADYQSNNTNGRNGNETNLSVFEELVWKPLKRTSLVHRFNYYWNPDDRDQYNYVLQTALRIRVTDLLGFEFSHNKSYDSDTGSRNNKDDTRWLNALILFF